LPEKKDAAWKKGSVAGYRAAVPKPWTPMPDGNVAVFLESMVLFLDACRFMVSKVSGSRVRNLGIQNISHII
jgi:hypothetical protein